MAISIDQQITSSSEVFKKIAPDLQGNILKSHGRDNAFHIFLKFKDAEKAKRFIKREILPRITSALQQKEDSEAAKANPRKRFRRFLSFSLSNSGYEFLNIDKTKTPNDASFRQGLKARARRLNDPNINEWEVEFQNDWHALIVIANTSERKLGTLLKTLKKKLTNDIIESFHVEIGVGIRNKEGNPIEHFGYVDGISQPHLLVDHIESGQISKNNWDPSASLDLALVKDLGGSNADSFGSYFVFRKLEQNVKLFKQAEENLAEALNTSVDIAGAQMVGRFRNGNTLIPISPPTSDSSGQMNDFNYSSDTSLASKCPFHAHIRKTNPRGSGGGESAENEKLHLFPRRGITYGGDFTKSDNHPEGGVGLLFMAYNSNISRQFEFMQGSWANSSSFPIGKSTSSHGIDPIIGQGNLNDTQNHFEKWGEDNSNKKIPSMGGFVTMKGGEYFFTPSISFLKSL